MCDAPHVVALPGSLRDASTTRQALEIALRAADGAGATTRLIDLREYALPVYDPDAPEPDAAERLRAEVARADGVLLGSPVYHGSYSGALKNALDFVGKDEFEDTTVGLLAVAGGSYPRPTLDHLRAVSRNLGAWTLPTDVVVPHAGSQFEDGTIVDEALADRVETLGVEIVRYAGVARYPDRTTTAEPPLGDD